MTFSDVREKNRVAVILARDNEDRQIELRRYNANIQVMNGMFTNISDTVVSATPEILEKGEFSPYAVEKTSGTVRSIHTVRRKQINQINNLHGRGVIDDDLYAACSWYRLRWESAGMDPSPSISSYATSFGGDKLYGHLPRSQWQAEARSDYRFAKKAIPDEMVLLFELVTLHDHSLRDAGVISRCRFRNITACFRAGALALFGAIAGQLDVRQMLQGA
jgi:hypothetical protein